MGLQVSSGRELAIVFDDHYDLPELGWDLIASPVAQVVGAQDRTGEHTDLHVELPGVFQDVILQILPGALVEVLMLWGCIGKMKSILSGLAPWLPPHGVQSAHQVAAVEIIFLVKIWAGLVSLVNARVEVPDIPLPSFGVQLSTVDVNRSEVSQPAGFAHDHREVGVLQLRSAAVLKPHDVSPASAGQLWQGNRLTKEIGFIALA